MSYSPNVNDIITNLNLTTVENENNTIKFKNELSPDMLIKELSKYKINKILIEDAPLEDVFLHYYK